MSPRDQLVALFRAGVEAARADRAVERALSVRPLRASSLDVLAVGKAAAPMARAALAALGGRVAALHVTAPEPVALRGAHALCAGHPLPDATSERAAREALALASGSERPLLVLISGGTSALWCAPAGALTLADKRAVHQALLRSGLPIEALNTVRRHLSGIKGGRLAQAALGRELRVLALSDVADDRPETIGSGPASPDPSSYADALAHLERSGARDSLPAAALAHLLAGARGAHPETPGPDDPAFERVEHAVVAGLGTALDGVRAAATALGLRAVVWGRALDADAAALAPALAARARQEAAGGDALCIAGGEPTVRVRGSGRGGRAQQLALGFALEIAGSATVALFAGTDGRDGPTDAAGAIVDGGSCERIERAGLDPVDALARNDAHRALDASGDLLRTGATGTNVNDLALIRTAP